MIFFMCKKVVICRLVLILFMSYLMSGCSSLKVNNKSATIQGMGIEKLVFKYNVSILTTTGGVFSVNLEEGTIEIRQRINKNRILAKVILDQAWSKTLLKPELNGFDCIWKDNITKKNRMIISGDSVVRLFNVKNVEVKLQFSPTHKKINESNNGLLALDNEGGLVIAPPAEPLERFSTKNFIGTTWTSSSSKPIKVLFIGICPPRNFDWKTSFLNVVHYSSHIQRYPTDEQIKEYSKYAKVLEMHQWVWQNRHNSNAIGEDGKNVPIWYDSSSKPQNFKWIPDDEEELKRVVKTAHDHGMKFIVYANLLHDFDKGSKGEVFQRHMNEIEHLKAEYEIDGLYLDGFYLWDPELGYKGVRALRDIFGEDGWFTFHNTRTKGYFFPFINAYMDFIVTSEHESFGPIVSTSYNVSNAVSSIWPEIPINIKDAREMLKEMVDSSLKYNNRLILMKGEKGQWRDWRLYFTKPEMEFMKNYYFKKLKK
jgi:hypothetical protein